MKLFLLMNIPLIILATTEESSKKKISINKEHLALDYFKIFGLVYDIYSEKEMDFQYFAAHDLDNNKKLDGLELFMALDHEFKHEELYADRDAEAEVDAIFFEYDRDNDGFLDYREFQRVQKEHEGTNTIIQSNKAEES